MKIKLTLKNDVLGTEATLVVNLERGGQNSGYVSRAVWRRVKNDLCGDIRNDAFGVFGEHGEQKYAFYAFAHEYSNKHWVLVDFGDLAVERNR